MDFYQSCMNTEEINAVGAEPLLAVINTTGNVIVILFLLIIWHLGLFSTLYGITVVFRASAHGCSTINLHFSPYWALAWCTGHLLCVKIEIGGVDLWAWYLHARYACACTRTYACSI